MNNVEDRTSMKYRRFHLENKIHQLLSLNNNNTAHFDYQILFEENKIKLDVYTYNATYDTYMLLHTTIEPTPLDALDSIITYLYNHNLIKLTESPYKITWKKEGDTEYKVSYFYDSSKDLALTKFFYGKNIIDYIYTIELMPIS